MSVNNGLALTPPLGWNSWDCYGTTVREDEVKANADFMAARLAQYGWNYIVVDIQWYEPNAQAHGYRENAELVTDGFSRVLPAVNRFPSAANDAGFKPLADYLHSLGLKFGIHIMRGIPRQAVRQNLPILNTPYHAQDIANIDSPCPWNSDNFGLDMSKPGAQAYYDSIAALYASWEVDYIKADDMLYPYHDDEIAALHQAIQKTKRAMLLSLSPGRQLTTDHYEHLRQNCELFRLSDDFWDRWEDLKDQFERCNTWAAFTGVGCWADADMLPLGHIGIRAERGVDRQSLLTHAEQVTLMTLWVISRSPLMFGGDLPSSDDSTITLLSNADVLQVQRASRDNHQLFRHEEQVGWIATATDSEDRYLALFNIGDTESSLIEVDLSMLGAGNRYAVRDLWDKSDLGVIEGSFRQQIAPHAAKLFRLSVP
ncbi:MAG: glycoside hydrolase family 27 protein [Chloroflexota bacterium]